MRHDEVDFLDWWFGMRDAWGLCNVPGDLVITSIRRPMKNRKDPFHRAACKGRIRAISVRTRIQL